MAETTLIDDYLKLEKEKIEQLIYGVEPKTATEMHKREELWKQAMVQMGHYKAGMRPPQTFNIDYANAFDQQSTYPQAVVKLNNEKENEKMDAKKCDRCGKLFEVKDSERWIRVPFNFCLDNRSDKEDLFKKYSEEYLKNEFLDKAIRITTGTEIEVELCPECRQALANWWEMGATRTTKE